ncbi:MAG TPA: hypothetical protein VHO50_02160, partial [Bacteroidales bacterium]|nr:hypothetical protein [Bacteroidales bacterium]
VSSRGMTFSRQLAIANLYLKLLLKQLINTFAAVLVLPAKVIRVIYSPEVDVLPHGYWPWPFVNKIYYD